MEPLEQLGLELGLGVELKQLKLGWKEQQKEVGATIGRGAWQGRAGTLARRRCSPHGQPLGHANDTCCCGTVYSNCAYATDICVVSRGSGRYPWYMPRDTTQLDIHACIGGAMAKANGPRFLTISHRDSPRQPNVVSDMAPG